MRTPRRIAGTPPSRKPSEIRCMLIRTCSSSSPDCAIRIITPTIVLGAGKNRMSIHPNRAAISHASSSPSGEPMLIRRSRRRAESRACSPMSTTSDALMALAPCAPIASLSWMLSCVLSCTVIAVSPPEAAGSYASASGSSRVRARKISNRRYVAIYRADGAGRNCACHFAARAVRSTSWPRR